MTLWQQLTLETDNDIAEAVADKLQDCGAYAISLANGDPQQTPRFCEAPNSMPLWQTIRIQSLFSTDDSVELVCLQLAAQFPSKIHYQNIDTIAEKDWVTETQKHFPAQHFSDKLWVIPSWLNAENYTKPVVTIDPGLAFGTGTHPTTRLCLEWLASHSPISTTVIDYGCGSGILSLAAAALGATKIYATDNDPQALTATRNNATHNCFLQAHPLEIIFPQQLPEISAPLVMANILATTLIDLASQLSQLTAPQGTLILSGLLKEQVSQILEAYPQFHCLKKHYQEEWALIELKKIS